MQERKVKGEPVIYVPAGETFTALDGQKYTAVLDYRSDFACNNCDFGWGSGLCGRYRCIGDDREDSVGVHFVKCEEEEQSKTN